MPLHSAGRSTVAVSLDSKQRSGYGLYLSGGFRRLTDGRNGHSD